MCKKEGPRAERSVITTCGSVTGLGDGHSLDPSGLEDYEAKCVQRDLGRKLQSAGHTGPSLQGWRHQEQQEPSSGIQTP